MRGSRALISVVTTLLLACGASDAAAAAKRADLRVTSIVAPAYAPSVALTDKTVNSGKATAKGSTTRYWLSADKVVGRGDVLIGRRSVPKLKRRKSSEGTAQFALPAAAPGAYYVIACADDLKKVRESSERNNCRASATQIRVPAAQPAVAPAGGGEGSGGSGGGGGGGSTTGGGGGETTTQPVTACTNGADDDGDGTSDANDPGCWNAADTSELGDDPCDNGADDDGDGKVDYRPGAGANDPGCTGVRDASEHGGVCDNGADDDADGTIDARQDPGCESLTDASEVGTTQCDNGYDDDAAYAFYGFPTEGVDYRVASPGGDPDCDSPTDTELPACANGIDDDGDILTDNGADVGCADWFDDDERQAGLPCDDGLDNDGDGANDFRPTGGGDSGCASSSDLSEAPDCADGLDNDHDGTTDAGSDPGCVNATDGNERGTTQCDNEVDDDGDSYRDYWAPNPAAGDAGCTGPADNDERTVCQNSSDDDGDGDVDLADAGCANAQDTSERTGTACDNGSDDDGDFTVDYPDDPGCANVNDTSERGVTACDNGSDDDGDFKTDYPADGGCDGPADTNEAGSIN